MLHVRRNIILFNMEIAKKRSRFCYKDVKILHAYGKCQVETLKKIFCKENKIEFFIFILKMILCGIDLYDVHN